MATDSGTLVSSQRGRKLRIWIKAIIAALVVAALGFWLKTLVGPQVQDVVVFVLALLAIGFAMYQFADSAELKEASTHIQGIVVSVAGSSTEIATTVKTVASASALIQKTVEFVAEHQLTQYIGAFPSNIDQIESLIERSKYKVKIMADVVGYGSYSRVREFLAYFEKLQQLRQRLEPPADVSILVYDLQSRKAALLDQFRADRWEEIKTTPQFNAFFGLHMHRLKRPQNHDEFIQALIDNHEYYERLLRDSGAKIIRTPPPFPFFMWLRDDCEAIFSFLNRRPVPVGDRLREITFATKDGKLIETFDSIFDELWASSQDIPKA